MSDQLTKIPKSSRTASSLPPEVKSGGEKSSLAPLRFGGAAPDSFTSEKRIVRKVAIVGLPNTGKSQIFNNLTGEYNIVANYERTTIEIKRALAKISNRFFEIIDTPSLHCLY
ncbi:MAG: 50S ribosome-binding GTPase, partial [Candidatus Omnitrophica bacterium]|nr:50S ribosome-binding GTPase [Candidatus Omnitrophota bacterium]